jgi:hypothetical protein
VLTLLENNNFGLFVESTKAGGRRHTAGDTSDDECASHLLMR